MTSSLLAGVLARYGDRYAPNPAGVTAAPAGFSGARVFRVETASGQFALRRMLRDQVEPARLSGLHRLIGHLHQHGVIEVPVPVSDLEGSTFCLVEKHVWQLEPWMPGSADFWLNPSKARLQNALRCLARVHLAAARFKARHSEAAWFQCACLGQPRCLTRRMELLEEWYASRRRLVEDRLPISDSAAPTLLARQIFDAVDKAGKAIARELRLASRVLVPLQPCVRDVWHDHLLFSGNEVTGLIDLHECRTDNVAADLARLVGSLVGDDRQGWDLALEAYAAVRPLSPEERALVEICDRSEVLLAGTTWLGWLLIERRPLPEPGKVLSRLQQVAARLKRLAATPG
jgi:Ser/Thr protein kinase RdoA (MazF antagonist)